MPFTFHLLLSTIFVWVLPVAARPAVLRAPSTNATSTIPYNDSLLYSPGSVGPWNPQGPAGFEITALHGYQPLHREACYMSAVHILAMQVKEDFEGRLPLETMEYNDPQYHDLTIVISTLGVNELMPRKFLVWGIAKIMHRMTAQSDFTDSWYELKWQGNVVGDILFNSQPPRAPLGGKLFHVSKPNDTSISADASSLSFEYRLIRQQILASKDVFMGTIGALVQLAQNPDHEFDKFAGGFPTLPLAQPSYNIRIFWTNDHLRYPLPLTKGMITDSMVAAVSYGARFGDFHALKVTVKNNGKEIAHGGYYSPPLSTESVSAS